MYSKIAFVFQFVFVFIVVQVNSFQTFRLRKGVKKVDASFATSLQVFEEEEDLPEFLKKKQTITLNGLNEPPPLCYHCKNYIHFTTLNHSTNERFMESPWYKNYLSFRQDELGTGFGLCKLFGNKLDLIRYSFAKHARENEDQCGRDGRLYEDIGFNFIKKEDEEKKEKQEKEEKEEKEEKSKDFIVIPYSMKEKEKEKETDLEDLKNVNTQLYEYSVFLKKNKNENK